MTGFNELGILQIAGGGGDGGERRATRKSRARSWGWGINPNAQGKSAGSVGAVFGCRAWCGRGGGGGVNWPESFGEDVRTYTSVVSTRLSGSYYCLRVDGHHQRCCHPYCPKRITNPNPNLPPSLLWVKTKFQVGGKR